MAPLAAALGEPMTLLDRYLARQVLWYTLLVTLVLVTLAALFVFIDQQSDVGVGSYGMLDALFVTLLKVPQQAFQLLPVAALIGALVGLGNLARGSELVVVRAAGVSVVRIALAAASAGVLLLAIGAVLGEVLAPPLEAYAEQIKTFGKYSNFSFAGRAGIWVKDGERIVSIQQQSADTVYGGVYVYTVQTGADGRQRLTAVARADRAEVVAGTGWRLTNYAESRLDGDGVVGRRLPTLAVTGGLSPEFLGAAVVDPVSLPIRGLWRYVQHLRANGLESRSWEVALWSRIARSLSTVLLCMLAVPFVLGPLRSAGAGSRTVIGIIVGVVYFLVNRTLENSGDVYGLDPQLVAWAPAALLALLTGAAIARVR
ncbi:MAG: LPS export ABC transporter permease LptG [Proteobacteria bacterium]|nr:LPS export ABC transporter permease LptG [Pseudomonadota bacterium]